MEGRPPAEQREALECLVEGIGNLLLRPAAKQVAAALEAHWQQPEQQQAAVLELARATGTRSCAYLRWVGVGGPWLGE